MERDDLEKEELKVQLWEMKKIIAKLKAEKKMEVGERSKNSEEEIVILDEPGGLGGSKEPKYGEMARQKIRACLS